MQNFCFKGNYELHLRFMPRRKYHHRPKGKRTMCIVQRPCRLFLENCSILAFNTVAFKLSYIFTVGESKVLESPVFELHIVSLCFFVITQNTDWNWRIDFQFITEWKLLLCFFLDLFPSSLLHLLLAQLYTVALIQPLNIFELLPE